MKNRLVRHNKYENHLSRFAFMEKKNVGGDFKQGSLFLKMDCTTIIAEGAAIFVPLYSSPHCNHYKKWFFFFSFFFLNVHLTYNSLICFQPLHQA
jgi:hypothetical protein